jgi:hypothetical protein
MFCPKIVQGSVYLILAEVKGSGLSLAHGEAAEAEYDDKDDDKPYAVIAKKSVSAHI